MITRVALLLLLASSSCRKIESPPRDAWRVDDDAVSLEHETPVQFETGVPEFGPPLESPAVTGRVLTLETLSSPSYPALPGRIAELVVRMGDRVKAGDKLVRVQTGELSLMQSEAAAARLSVQTKQATVEKLERMVEARLATEHELIVAKAELAEAQLAARTAGSRLRSLSVGQANTTSYWLLANRDGAVVQLDAALGKQVRPDQESPVATIADLDEVLVMADVSQREAARLQPGGAAKISIPGWTEAPIGGVVQFVSDIVDPDRQTVPVRVLVDNRDRRLRPNTYVDVTFVAADQTPLLRVPASAVVRDGAKTIVFVEVGELRYRAREVEVGRRTKDVVEIIHGLAPGERIVVTNALLLLNAIELQA